jgi:hypothetical protein
MTTVNAAAYFEPAAYRQSIAEMFGVLDADQQRELVDKLALLPRHIHRLANEGLIADRGPGETRPAQAARR